jgi:hypothetical protein
VRSRMSREAFEADLHRGTSVEWPTSLTVCRSSGSGFRRVFRWRTQATKALRRHRR